MPCCKAVADDSSGVIPEPLVRQVDPNTPVFHMPVHLPLGGDGLYVTGDEFRIYHKAVVDLFEWLTKHFEDNGGQYYPR